MTTVYRCPKCGTEQSSDALEGLCHRCVVKITLGPADASVRSLAATHTAFSGLAQQFGDYELLDEIARGGMGVVYRARQVSLNRRVAVKMIRSGIFAGEAEVKRFHGEAEAAASLDHPNIVPIYEVGEQAGQHYFAMKLIEGSSLASRISNPKSQISNQDAGALLLKVARAVHYAHQRGILHRDLKPGNILIDSQGEPHVTDFGLAKRLSDSPFSAVQSQLTLSGALIGTPSYMSPEQATGNTKQITTATDVYSLGAILYELLSGCPPFSGGSTLEVLRKVMEEEPVRPSQLRRSRCKTPASPLESDRSPLTSPATSLDSDLETICLKCLEKDTQRRYNSAAAMVDDLERWLRHEPILARLTTPAERVFKWVRRHPARAGMIGMFLLVLMMGVIGIAWQWRRAEAHAEESRQRLVRLNVANGVHRIEEGDFLAALPWFVESLRLDRMQTTSPGRGNPSRDSGLRSSYSPLEESHRIRFATTLRGAPRLIQMWFHDEAVNDAQFSSDGSRVVTASSDQTARIWDAVSGQPLSPPLMHAAQVVHAVFSPDGQRLATGCKDGSFRLWNGRTGAPLTPLLRHRQPKDPKFERFDVSFSPDGKKLLTAGASSAARLWNAESGEEMGPPLSHAGNSWVTHASFSPDGRWVATADFAGRVRIWDAPTGQPSGPTFEHGTEIRHIEFTPDSRTLVTAGNNGGWLWDAASGASLAFLGHLPATFHAHFSPDSTRVITAGQDATARIWDATTGQASTPALQHGESVLQSAFSPDGRWVVTASEDHSVRVWDATTGALLFPPLWHGHTVRHAMFSPDGRRVLTASVDGVARLWDLASGRPAFMVLRGEGTLHHAWFGHDPRHLITVGEDKTVQVWDVTTGATLGPPLHLDSSCRSADLSPDAKRLVTGTRDNFARVWDVTASGLRSQSSYVDGLGPVVWRPDGRAFLTVSGGRPDTAQVWDGDSGAPITSPMQHRHHITHGAFSPDGQRIATASNDETARVWHAQTGAPVTPPLPHEGPVIRVCFSLDGTRLATASTDNTARIWNAATGEPISPPLRHGGWVNDVRFSPDGRRVATCSDDGTARVWDAATGQPLTPPLWLRGGVENLCWTRDGHRLLANNGSGVMVWDVNSGLPLTPVFTPHAPVLDACFSSNEQQMLAVTPDRRVLSWDISASDSPLEDLALTARLLTSRQVDATGALVPLDQAARTVESGNSSAYSTSHPKAVAVRTVDVLRADWEHLGARLVPKLEIARLKTELAWHEQQASTAEVNHQWFAAAFHLGRVCAARTNDLAWLARRDLAQARASHLGLVPVTDRIQPRPPKASPQQIDLTRHYNALLTENWFDSYTTLENSLASLPTGLQEFAGVLFDVRGIMQLRGKSLATAPEFPSRISGILIARSCQKLHFLMAAGRAFVGDRGQTVGQYVMHYANGGGMSVPLRVGEEIGDWWDTPGTTCGADRAEIVWTGSNEAAGKKVSTVRLYKWTWNNPYPDEELRSLDLSATAEFAPFLIAITAE